MSHLLAVTSPGAAVAMGLAVAFVVAVVLTAASRFKS